MGRLFGTDGVRGLANTDLTAEQVDVIVAAGGSGLRTAAGYTGDDDGWNAAILGAGAFGDAKVLLGYVYRTGNELENAAGVPPDNLGFRLVREPRSWISGLSKACSSLERM